MMVFSGIRCFTCFSRSKRLLAAIRTVRSVLQMKKAPTDRPAVAFSGLTETKAFLEEALQRTRSLFRDSDLYPHPAAFVPVDQRDRQWTTDYMWLGDRPRTVRMRIATDKPGRVLFGVNRTDSDTFWSAVTDVPPQIADTPGFLETETTLFCDPDWTYSIYGNALDGAKLLKVDIIVQKARSGDAGTSVVTSAAPTTTMRISSRAE